MATLTGCGTIDSLFGGAQRDEGTNEVTEGGTESVFDIAEGDCLTEPDSTGEEVYDVEVVPCSEPHDYELYHEFSLDAGETLPGSDAIDEEAQTTCAKEFEKFVGVAFSESKSLWYSYYSPTEASWDQGDDLIQCLVYEASDDAGEKLVQVEGTLEGSKR